MNPKEKAKELIGKFLPNVYCYLGSGMLTNEYSEEVALSNAKKQALICVEEIICSLTKSAKEMDSRNYECYNTIKMINYYQVVKQELDESTNK